MVADALVSYIDKSVLKSQFISILVLIEQPHRTVTVATVPDSKIHGANTGPTWVLLAPDGLHVGPMDLAIREGIRCVG